MPKVFSLKNFALNNYKMPQSQLRIENLLIILFWSLIPQGFANFIFFNNFTLNN